MALYRVHFIDHGENLYGTSHIEHDSDDAAIATAQYIHALNIGAGFEVWQDNRLMHRHRN